VIDAGLLLDFFFRGWWPALHTDAQTLIPWPNLDLTGTHRSVPYFKALDPADRVAILTS